MIERRPGYPGAWRSATTLDDMVRLRDDFLADGGCAFDLDGIATELGDPPGDDTALLGAWFDQVVEGLAGKPVIEAYRHVLVDDAGVFAEFTEAGVHPGRHWSLRRDTVSPDPDRLSDSVMMRAEIPEASVDWASTFQAWFSHPWEREITVSGPVRVVEYRDLDTGDVIVPGSPAGPIP